MTKIDIFSGFLGAGKTTLIKKLLREAYAGERVVLIENEFGEIGIDGGFLREAGIEITEMNSGCICCSLVGDFTRSLSEVLSRFSPDRILIEPSGVGKLSDVRRAVEGVEGVSVSGTVTVVDVNKCKMYMKNFGEFFGDQITNAGTVIFSHTDRTTPAKLDAALDLVREANPHATVITTPWDELDGRLILETVERRNTLEAELAALREHEHHHHHHEHGEDCTCGCHGHHEHEHHDHEHDHEHEHHEHEHEHEHEHHHHHHEHGEDCTCGCHDHHDHEHHHHHHADDVFDSFGVETARRFTREEVSAALAAFAGGEEYGTVLRAKGILPSVEGEWIHFDYVPGEPDVRLGGAEVIGRLCVIGTGLDRAGITRLFGLSEE